MQKIETGFIFLEMKMAETLDETFHLKLQLAQMSW